MLSQMKGLGGWGSRLKNFQGARLAVPGFCIFLPGPRETMSLDHLPVIKQLRQPCAHHRTLQPARAPRHKTTFAVTPPTAKPCSGTREWGLPFAAEASSKERGLQTPEQLHPSCTPWQNDSGGQTLPHQVREFSANELFKNYAVVGIAVSHTGLFPTTHWNLFCS